MFGGKIGLPELLLLVAIALLIFGPSKLADLGKGLGDRGGQHLDVLLDMPVTQVVREPVPAREREAHTFERACHSGRFVVTVELAPPDSADPTSLIERANRFKPLVDAINIMLQQRALFRISEVQTWLDTGTLDATLSTNRHLLKRERFSFAARSGVTVKEPVFIHPTAIISNSTIGLLP